MSVPDYEKHARLSGLLPEGWDQWYDIQKQIHVMSIMGQRTTQQPRANSTQVGEAQRQQRAQPQRQSGFWQMVKGLAGL